MIRCVREPGLAGGAVGEIILDRPEKRNALTPAMLADLARTAEELSRDDSCRCILLRGEGFAFCSGFDLTLVTPDAAGDGVLRDMLTGLSAAVRALRRARQPVVCAVHGAAIAGGCALLGGADFIVTHASAKLGYPVASLGISPAVSAPSLLQLVEDRGARALQLDPRPVSGEEAVRMGLAHRLVDLPEDVIPRTQLEAAEFAKKPPHALAATKAWLNEVDGSLDDGAFSAALRASLSLVGHPEQRKRVAALFTRS